MIPLSPTILSIRCECILESQHVPNIRRMLRAISKDLQQAHDQFDPNVKNRIDQALVSLNDGNMAEAKSIVHSISNIMSTP